MLCYSEISVTLCCVWVFFPEEFNSCQEHPVWTEVLIKRLLKHVVLLRD